MEKMNPYDDYEEESLDFSAERKLHDSAPSRLSSLSIQSSSPLRKYIRKAFKKGQALLVIHAPWLFRITGQWDRVMGCLEKWHSRQGHPSIRAWKEALSYYGRYADEGPNAILFTRLIRRNGLPDWANPFPEGHQEHYRYHPLGLMVADVELILEGWLSHLPEWEDASDIPLVRWPTPKQAGEGMLRKNRINFQKARSQARVCWALAVLSGDLLRIKTVVHSHNLMAATADTVLNGNLLKFNINPDDVWTAALEQRLVPKTSPRSLWSKIKAPRNAEVQHNGK